MADHPPSRTQRLIDAGNVHTGDALTMARVWSLDPADVPLLQVIVRGEQVVRQWPLESGALGNLASSLRIDGTGSRANPAGKRTVIALKRSVRGYERQLDRMHRERDALIGALAATLGVPDSVALKLALLDLERRPEEVGVDGA